MPFSYEWRVLRIAIASLLLLAACDDDAVDCDAPGVLCTIVGTGLAGNAGIADGLPPLQSELYLPVDVAFDAQGDLLVVDFNNHAIRRLHDGVLQTIIGTGYLGDHVDGPARQTGLKHPTHVTTLPDGTLAVAGWHDPRILHYDPVSDTVVSWCGTGERGFDGDGHAADATELNLPVATATDMNGRLLIADQGNQRVRRVEADGTVSTIVGTGVAGYGGDGGPAVDAQIASPQNQDGAPAGKIARGPDGTLYLADTLNQVVRAVSPDGIIRTVVTPALSTPSDVAVDPQGRLYIADTFSSCVRMIAPDGTATTVAGRCGERGYTGDGGPADRALLDRPYGIELDVQRRLWIADTHNNVIRRVQLP